MSDTIEELHDMPNWRQHHIEDEFGAEMNRGSEVHGTKDVYCSCGQHGWQTVAFEVRHGVVNITDGPTCGLAYDTLAERIEEDLEPEDGPAHDDVAYGATEFHERFGRPGV